MPSEPREEPQAERPAKLDRHALEKVAAIFRVLSEPTRLAIVQELKEGPCSVSELVDRLQHSQANVSKQLRTLHDAGFLRRERSGNQVFYEINEDVVFSLCEIVCDKLNRDRESAAAFNFSI